MATEVGADYFGNRLFLFLPNVCDASCSFCYVKPAVAAHAHLARPTLRKVDALLAILSGRGFAEVRLTGGEPLLVGNLDELVEIITGHGMRFTVLTNGGRLGRWQGLFTTHPPAKITVSVHTTSAAADIFGAGWEIGEVLESIHALARDTAVTATIVAVAVALPDIDRTVRDLVDAGVRELKLVLPNTPAGRPSAGSFTTLARAVRAAAGPTVRVRMSDVARTGCVLHDMGQLSVALPSMRLWSCCAKVGDDDFVRLAHVDASTVSASLRWAHDQLARSGAGLPCDAHYGACPIALTGPPDE